MSAIQAASQQTLVQKDKLARIGRIFDRSAMRFDQKGVICSLCDAGTKGWKYIAEQQSDQLLPGWGRPAPARSLQ
jgi:hypothetical protein